MRCYKLFVNLCAIKPKNMKKNLLFWVFIITMGVICSCEKEKLADNYAASYRIDSVKQDSVLFAHNYWLKGKVRVYYTVINDDKVVLNCYRYTINAMSCDSILFQIAESHYNTVAPNSERHDSTKIGIGNCKVAWTSMDNTLFQ